MNWRQWICTVFCLLVGQGLFGQTEPESALRDAWLQNQGGRGNERLRKGSIVRYGHKDKNSDGDYHVFHGLMDSLAVFDVDTVPVAKLTFVDVRDMKKFERNKDGSSIAFLLVYLGLFGFFAFVLAVYLQASTFWLVFFGLLTFLGALALPLLFVFLLGLLFSSTYFDLRRGWKINTTRNSNPTNMRK